jgi:hypothetical protein
VPEVPLYNNGESLKFGRLPLPVLDRENRGSAGVNYGGVQRGIGQVVQSADGLTRAMAPVLLNPNMFDGERQGLEALGKGVQAVGAMFQEVVEREAQAKNYADLADAEMAMNQELANFETWKQANLARPESWREEWQRRLTDLGKRFDKNETWSPVVKQKLGVEFGRFAGQSGIRIGTDATKATFARASEALGARFEMSVLNKDLEGAKAAKAESVAMGLETPERAAVDLFKANRGVARLELQEAIKTMPSVVLSFLGTKGDAETRRTGDTETNAATGVPISGGTADGTGVPNYIRDLTEAEKVEARDLATASLFDQKRNLLNLGTQEIKAGHIKNAQELEAWIETNDPTVVLDAADYEHLEEVIAGNRPLNQDTDWNEAVAAITQFPVKAPEAEKRKQEAYLKSQFDRRFDGPVKAELYEMLEERLQEYDDAKAADFRDIVEMSESMLKTGKFGKVTAQALDEKGRVMVETHNRTYIPKEVPGWRLFSPSTWGTTRPGTIVDAVTERNIQTPKMAVDPKLLAEAEAKRRHALKTLQTWIKEQKLPPSRAEVIKKWDEVTGTTTAANEAEAYINTGTGLDNALFGFPPADAAQGLRDMMKQ